jgi:CheY-like chemotaxis protein
MGVEPVTCTARQRLVLVVDDDPRALALMTIVLGKAGYRVATATGGDRGLETLSTERPDLVIVDLLMPGMDGLEFCRRVRAQTQSADLPLMLSTAMATDDVRQQALGAGVDAVLTKPFERPALLEELARLLDADRLNTAGRRALRARTDQ